MTKRPRSPFVGWAGAVLGGQRCQSARTTPAAPDSAPIVGRGQRAASSRRSRASWSLLDKLAADGRITTWSNGIYEPETTARVGQQAGRSSVVSWMSGELSMISGPGQRA